MIGVLRDRSDGGAPAAAAADDRRPRDLVEQNRRPGMGVTLLDDVPTDPCAVALGRTVYRVLQEALTNARKHAPASRVAISLAGRRGADRRGASAGARRRVPRRSRAVRGRA